MVTKRIMRWKPQLPNHKITRKVKCYALCSLDGFFIGLAGGCIIRKIGGKFTGILSSILQELSATGVLMLSGMTGYYVEKGFSQQ